MTLSMSSILGDIYRRNNQYAVTDKCTLANMLAILTDIGDGGEDVHTYIAINEADLAPKKVCFERGRPSLSKTRTL